MDIVNGKSPSIDVTPAAPTATFDPAAGAVVVVCAAGGGGATGVFAGFSLPFFSDFPKGDIATGFGCGSTACFGCSTIGCGSWSTGATRRAAGRGGATFEMGSMLMVNTLTVCGESGRESCRG